MFNVVSSHVAQVHLPSGSHKYAHMIDFKMACHIVRKYFRRAFKGSYGAIYAELVSYSNPVRPGRSDIRNMRTKSPVGFVYRVA